MRRRIEKFSGPAEYFRPHSIRKHASIEEFLVEREQGVE
jgi:hypothetical protein